MWEHLLESICATKRRLFEPDRERRDVFVVGVSVVCPSTRSVDVSRRMTIFSETTPGRRTSEPFVYFFD